MEKDQSGEGRKFLNQQEYKARDPHLKLHVMGRLPSEPGDEAILTLIWRSKPGGVFEPYKQVKVIFLSEKDRSVYMQALSDPGVLDPAFPENTVLDVQEAVIHSFELPEEESENQ